MPAGWGKRNSRAAPHPLSYRRERDVYRYLAKKERQHVEEN